MRQGATGETAKDAFEVFKSRAREHNLVPVYTRIMSDQLTPVAAYQRLVRDDRCAPSFLFESVQNGTDSGRYSFVGAWPDLEILARGNAVTVLDHCQVCPSPTLRSPREHGAQKPADRIFSHASLDILNSTSKPNHEATPWQAAHAAQCSTASSISR